MSCPFFSKLVPSILLKHTCNSRKGSALMMVTVVASAVMSGLALTTAKISQSAISGMNALKTSTQAEQYARAEADIIRATAYTDLAAKSKADISNSNGYKREIILSDESNYSESIKQRDATVIIYYGNEALPRYSLKIKKTSVEASGGGGVPVGTIIAWASSTAPTEGGTWLLCNGQSCSAYPQLSALIGNTVPSLNGRFLEGTTGTPRSTKEAGLPNITGNLQQAYVYPGSVSGYGSGALSWGAKGVTWGGGGGDYPKYTISFDASKSNAIYGKASTVQPASYLVRYYIKAAD